jgi:hypothetical protein
VYEVYVFFVHSHLKDILRDYKTGSSNLRYTASVDGDSNLSSISEVYILLLIYDHFCIQQSAGKLGIRAKDTVYPTILYKFYKCYRRSTMSVSCGKLNNKSNSDIYK